MKIKYLKVMHNAEVGDVLEVTDFEANILIKTGVAEEYKKTKVIKELVYEPINTKGLLLNLNGTPVVNDFGELVKQPKKTGNKKAN